MRIGLYMKDLLDFIRDRRDTHDYFPDEEEIPKQGKQWVKNMLRILCEDEFRAWVAERCRLHRAKADHQRNLNVSATRSVNAGPAIGPLGSRDRRRAERLHADGQGQGPAAQRAQARQQEEAVEGGAGRSAQCRGAAEIRK